MRTAEAFVTTERPDRYLVQLTRHAGQMQRHFGHAAEAPHEAGEHPAIEGVETSDVDATLRFAGGRCLIRTRPQGLHLRVEAEDEQSLRRVQEGVGKRLETLGTKDRLQVIWNSPEGGLPPRSR